MNDLPEASSPYVILREGVGPEKSQFVELNRAKVEPGPPPRIGWAPSSYGKSSDRPGPIFGGYALEKVSKKAGLAPGIIAIVSEPVHSVLQTLAGDHFEGVPLELIGPEGDRAPYAAIRPRARLTGRKASEARPGDLQWGNAAFAAADAPAPVFVLAISQFSDGQHLVVSQTIADALRGFPDLIQSRFHKTPEGGGARPAVAALTRILERRGQPEDEDVVRGALRDEREKK